MNTAELKLELFRKIDTLKDGKKGLLKLVGSMSAEVADKMLKDIEESCEKIDQNEW